jgi:phage antirepressor YoqD-like protein
MKEERSNADGDLNRVDDDASGDSKGKVAFESYDRVVRDNKKLQSRLKELESALGDSVKKIDEFEKTELEKQGRKDELIDKLKKELNERDSKLKESHTTFAYRALTEQIKGEAEKMGCVNADKLLKLIGQEDLAGIKIDSKYNADREAIKNMLERAKEEHSDIGLFGIKTTKINDVVPGSQSQKIIGKDDLKNLSIEQLKELHKKQSIKERG